MSNWGKAEPLVSHPLVLIFIIKLKPFRISVLIKTTFKKSPLVVANYQVWLLCEASALSLCGQKLVSSWDLRPQACNLYEKLSSHHPLKCLWGILGFLVPASFLPCLDDCCLICSVTFCPCRGGDCSSGSLLKDEGHLISGRLLWMFTHLCTPTYAHTAAYSEWAS